MYMPKQPAPHSYPCEHNHYYVQDNPQPLFQTLIFQALQISGPFFSLGEKMGGLTHEKIKESKDKKAWIYDITTRDCRMVLACRGEGVMMFNIKY